MVIISKMKMYFFEFLTVLSCAIFLIPFFIILSRANNPMDRIYDHYWMYLICGVSGILFLLLSGIPFLINLFRKKIAIDLRILFPVFWGAFVMFFTFHHFQELSAYKKDIALYENGKLSEVTGVMEVTHEPFRGGRGNSDYLYHIKVDDKMLFWFQKKAPFIDIEKEHVISYVPNTKQIITIK